MTQGAETRATHDLPLVVGDLVAGKYRVDTLVGRGGMGAVFAATHVGLGHSVALKVITVPLATRDEGLIRFEREARAVAAMTSPHVARVFDLGQLESGIPFIVMELLSGESLGAAIERGPMAVDVVIKIMREICDALAEAHGLGVVHRDLKPDNIFLARRPNGQTSAKVLDFGISKVTAPSMTGGGPDLTTTQGFLGTPSFMAPEQFTSARKVTVKADVWSLGILAFKMLTTVSPFAAQGVFEIAEKIVRGPTPTVADHRDDIPPALVLLIERCLSKEPSARPSIDEVLGALVVLTAHATPDSPVVIHATAYGSADANPGSGIGSATVAAAAADHPRGAPSAPAPRFATSSDGTARSSFALPTRGPAPASGSRTVTIVAVGVGVALGTVVVIAIAARLFLRGAPAVERSSSSPTSVVVVSASPMGALPASSASSDPRSNARAVPETSLAPVFQPAARASAVAPRAVPRTPVRVPTSPAPDPATNTRPAISADPVLTNER